eukprot:gene7604-5364_t
MAYRLFLLLSLSLYLYFTVCESLVGVHYSLSHHHTPHIDYPVSSCPTPEVYTTADGWVSEWSVGMGVYYSSIR